MPTTAGSYALETSMPPDAFLVTRLRDAGAIILGKANLSEWANIRSFPSSSGWSAIGGQANNPYALDRNPCGSSSGSAVAVAANLATVAVGTETDGSIVCPAGNTGTVGLKPSIGLVSRSGIVPISEAQDTAGPITRNVTDAAILVDPADVVVDAAYETEFTALLCEFKHGIAAYLATLPADMPKSLQDLIDFNLANAEIEMEHFKQEIRRCPGIGGDRRPDLRGSADDDARGGADGHRLRAPGT